MSDPQPLVDQKPFYFPTHAKPGVPIANFKQSKLLFKMAQQLVKPNRMPRRGRVSRPRKSQIVNIPKAKIL